MFKPFTTFIPIEGFTISKFGDLELSFKLRIREFKSEKARIRVEISDTLIQKIYPRKGVRVEKIVW